MPPSHDKEAAIFQACFDLAPPEQQAYLDSACGTDAALRARVERLLAAHLRADRATLQPIAELAPLALPDAIGPYRLVRLVGEGGMGLVYEAEQVEPIRRKVALKIVKLGMDTQQVVARFAAERQALAAMDHPYVAKVFDAGRTASGRPYFVMELVPGEPLIEYCTRNRLSTRERVALFVLVCQAVQHAHQKGVIHRDLKPSNLLVSGGDAGPVPKVIDFGIAKAVGRDERDAAGDMTRPGQALGTPAYMSPEQAGLIGGGGAPIDVDTRTDIYSLGVSLYELLTGLLPADPHVIGETEFLARLARGELDVPRPSSRLAAQGRRAGHARDARLSEDLDWIVMKALEADRTRRYETALSLADDLARYLRDEPVSARPPELSYRARKYLRRHRAQVAAALVAATALTGGAAAAAVGLVRATRAEAVAREEAATARQVSEFLTDLFAASDPNLRSSSTLREILDRGAARVGERLREQPRVQSRLYRTFSHVYGALGVHRDAIALAERTLALDAAAGAETLQTAEAALTLGRSRQNLGDFEGARGAYELALAIRTRLLGEHDLAVAEVLNNLGGLHGQLERYDEALSAHTRALAIQTRARGSEHVVVTNSLRGLAVIHSRQQRFDTALALDRQVLAIRQKTYGDRHPLVGAAFEDLAWDLKGLHQFPDARSAAEQALAIQAGTLGPDHPKVAFSHHLLGQLLEALGQHAEATRSYREALRIRERSLGADNPRTADVLTSIGLLDARLGRAADARTLLARALRIYTKAYGPAHSKTVQGEKNLAMAATPGISRAAVGR